MGFTRSLCILMPSTSQPSHVAMEYSSTKKMPFGLKNAPATFQLLMQTVLLHLEDFCSTFIDDVIFSNSWSEHISHIESVLSHLEQHRLTVKKFFFAFFFLTFLGLQIIFEFLGYIVGNDSLSIPDARIN